MALQVCHLKMDKKWPEISIPRLNPRTCLDPATDKNTCKAEIKLNVNITIAWS